jgi:ribosomal protein L37AE/L43A
MTRPKGPSPESVKRIYAVLDKEAKSFEDIVSETGLHGNTVGSTLETLEAKGMVERFWKGHKRMCALKRTEPADDLWRIPWIVMMMTQTDQEKKCSEAWKRTRREIKLSKWIDCQKDLMVDFTFSPQNRDVLETLKKAEVDLDSKSLKEVWSIVQRARTTPMCPECLKNKDVRFFTKSPDVQGEMVCRNCGLTMDDLFSEEPLATKKRLKKV